MPRTPRTKRIKKQLSFPYEIKRKPLPDTSKDDRFYLSVNYAKNLLKYHYDNATDKIEIDFFLHKVSLLCLVICNRWDITDCFQKAVVLVLLVMYYEKVLLRDALMCGEFDIEPMHVFLEETFEHAIRDLIDVSPWESLTPFFRWFSIHFANSVQNYFLNPGDALKFENFTFSDFKNLNEKHLANGTTHSFWGHSWIGRTNDCCDKIYCFKYIPSEGR